MRAGKTAPNMALRDTHGNAYVGGVPAFYSGVRGLLITRIPEEDNPIVYTVTHYSGLRIGTSRFESVDDACKLVNNVFGSKVDFTVSAPQLRQDASFGLLMRQFIDQAQQVAKNFGNTTKIDIVADIKEGGVTAVRRRFSG